MDVAKALQEIINSTVNTVQQSSDQPLIENVLFLTNNMLYVLDDNKSVDYKIAILSEYLEGIANVVKTPNVVDLLTLLQKSDKKDQQQIINQVHNIIHQFFSPQQVNPQMVVFWLQKPCDIQTLKHMDTLMLFLSKEQQSKVVQLDKTFLHDPTLVKIKTALANI
jgi:hypothetical protein